MDRKSWKEPIAGAWWPAPTLLVAMIWAPFLARAVAGRSALALPLMHDIGLQWVPFRMFIARSLAEGFFPLWAPQVYAGFPFQAFSHSGVFYPPGWLLLLGEYARSVNFFYPIQLSIAGTGVYALARKFGLGRPAAWFTAFSYSFTVKPFYFIHFLPATCSNPWAPWFLFGAIMLLSTGSFIYAALTGLFLALQVLGGDVESTSYGLLFSALFLVLMAPSLKIKWRRFALLLFPLAIGGVMAAVQALPLAELSRHFVRNHGVTFAYFSQRQLPSTLLFALFLPIKGSSVNEVQFLDAPYFYMGAVTMMLALITAARRLTPGSRRLGILTLVSSLWAFGSIGLLDRIQYSIPVLNRFGSPEQAFFMCQLFLCLLAGQGVEALKTGEARKVVRWAGVAALAGAVLRIGAGPVGIELLSAPWFLLAAATATMAWGVWERMRAAGKALGLLAGAVIAFQVIDLYGLAFIHLPSTDPKGFGYPPRLANLAKQVRALNARYIMITRDWLTDEELLYHAGIGLDMDAVDGWITVPPRNYVEYLSLIDKRAAQFENGKLDRLGFVGMRDGRFIDASTMPLIDLLDLRFFIVREIPLKFSSPFVLFESPAEVHKRMVVPGVPSMFRPEEEPSQESASGLPASPYELLSYKIYINAPDRLEVPLPSVVTDSGAAGACEFAVRLSDADTATALIEETVEAATRAPGRKTTTRAIALSSWTGKTVDLQFEFTCPTGRSDLKLYWDSPRIVNPTRPIMREAFEVSPQIHVYRNREALPRAFVVHSAVLSADRQDRLRHLAAAGREELARRVLVERDVSEWLAGRPVAGSRMRDTAREISRRPGEEVYEVASRGPGLLFVSDQYYPGWRAEVGGREVPIFRADHCFRAVPVPDGKSVVRMVFSPAAFRIGLWMTLAGVVSGLAAGLARLTIIR